MSRVTQYCAVLPFLELSKSQNFLIEINILAFLALPEYYLKMLKEPKFENFLIFFKNFLRFQEKSLKCENNGPKIE